MSRKERRITESKKKHLLLIDWGGKNYTVEEANSLARHEYQSRHLQAAADIYHHIIVKSPCADACFNRGVILRELGQYEEAIACYDRAIALKPDQALIYSNRGNVLQIVKRYEEALGDYNQAIALEPHFINAYINQGSALQLMHRYEEALTSFSKALELKPDYVDAYIYQAGIFHRLKQDANALACYDKAIALAPNFAEIYDNRGTIFYYMKQYEAALQSYNQAIALKPNYAPAYNNCGNLLHELGKYDQAINYYHKATQLNPHYTDAYNNLGACLQQLKRYDEALASYGKAITLKPGNAEAYRNLGSILHKVRRYDEALTIYEHVITLCPDDAQAYNYQGNVLRELGRYREALMRYDKAIALSPDYAEAYNNRGTTLVSMGNMLESEKMFMHARTIKPEFLSPIFNLTNIRHYKDTEHTDINDIKRLLERPDISQKDRGYLYFSLGKIYDDCRRYDDAFEAYRQANLISNSQVSYDAAKVTDMTKNTIDVFTKDFLSRSFDFSSISKMPVFIIGMPRSGTTLMANILSNHPQIGTAGELPTIRDMSLSLQEQIKSSVPYPPAATALTSDQALHLIKHYETRLRRDVSSDKSYVIDKHPLNFMHLGLIAMLFPDALVIHCTRHPLDIGLSNYQQRFSEFYDYSFDMENIAHFYGEYRKLIEHWRQVLPLTMIDISYEDMVRHTEKTARKILNILGLAWDERCLSPHTNPCAVETASQWQVRQPIYNQSVERWRHYEKHLEPLMKMLDY